MPEIEPFVARQAELARLHGMLDLAMAGKGQVCFVAGEAGTGKTALSEAFQHEAHARYADLVIAGGACDAQMGDETPYAPFHEIMAALTSGATGRVVAPAVKTANSARAFKALRLVVEAVGKFGPDLVGVFLPGTPFIGKLAEFVIDQAGLRDKLKKKIGLKDSGRPLLTSGTLTQDQIIEQFVNVLKDLSAKMPLLLVVDDLHWADMASIGMIFRLIRRVADCRILLVCALRPHDLNSGHDETGHPLQKVIAEAQRLRGDVWLDLTAATEARGREFVDALIDCEPNQLDRAFRDKLFAHTEGHPLFTVELIRDFRDRGILKLDDSGALTVGGPVDWSAIPARVEGVVAARLSGLPADLRELLDIASVEGPEFTSELLAKVAARESREVVRQLSGPLQNALQIVRGLDSRRIGQQRLSRYRFSHQLMRKYLYEALDDVERSYLHESIGLGLEALFGPHADEIAPQLARQFEAAGLTEKACQYLGRAAEQAAASYANEAALDYFNRALALTPVDATSSRVNLLSGRERIFNVLGQRDRQRADLDALQELAVAPADESLRTELLLRRASLALEVSDYPAAVDAAQAAEALAEQTDSAASHLQRATAVLTRARAHFLRGEAEACRAALEAALALSRSASLPAREAWALEQQGILRWSVGDYRGAREKLEEALALYGAIEDPRAEWSVLNNLGIVATEQRDFVEAERCFSAARAIVARIGLRVAEARLLVNEGDAGYESGNYVLSRDCARDALEIAVDVSDRRLRSICGVNLAETLIEVGDFASARRHVDDALGLASEIGFVRGVCACRELLARIHFDSGNAAVSLAEAAVGAALAREHRLGKRLVSLEVRQARALSALGRVEEALAAAADARAEAHRLGSPMLVAQADAARAEALLVRGNPADVALAIRVCLPEVEMMGHASADRAPIELPLWTHLILMRALVAAGDDRAARTARDGVEALRHRAGRISDLAMRRGFVDDVPEHAALQRLHARLVAESAQS